MGNWLNVLPIAWLVGLDLPHSGLLHIATHILRTCEVPFQQHTKLLALYLLYISADHR